MAGRFNSFQKTMLQWNDLHPYNAIHVVRIPAAPDLPRLRKVIADALQQLGLSSLILNRDRGTFEYQTSQVPIEVKVIEPGSDPNASLRMEVERQLNTAFPYASEQFSPFRFFAIPEPDTFQFGLVYFHPISDADSIVFLLKHLSRTYQGAGSTMAPNDLERYPRVRGALLRRPALFARKLAGLPRFIQDLRRSCRPRYRDIHDLQNRFVLFPLKSGHLRSALNTARNWNITLNDLFLALLMKSLAPLAAGRAKGRRNRLSVGCIVSTRKDLGVAGRRMLGVFLGSFIVTREIPGAIDLADLAKDIRERTSRIKQQKLYVAAPLEFTLGRWMLSFFSTGRRKKLYQKHYPLWGGITNMNLNSVWTDANEPAPADYFRAVSTGPVTPLVLSVTTAGDRLNLGITWRATVFSDQEIERIRNDLIAMVDALEVKT